MEPGWSSCHGQPLPPLPRLGPGVVLRGAEQLPHMPRDGQAGGLQSVALTPFPSYRTSDDVWPAAGSFGWRGANAPGPPVCL